MRIVYVPKAAIWHKGGRSTGGGSSPFYIYYLYRNKLILRKKHCFGIMRWISLPIFALGYIYAALRVTMINKKSGCVKAIAAGISDYFKKNWKKGYPPNP